MDYSNYVYPSVCSETTRYIKCVIFFFLKIISKKEKTAAIISIVTSLPIWSYRCTQIISVDIKWLFNEEWILSLYIGPLLRKEIFFGMRVAYYFET